MRKLLWAAACLRLAGCARAGAGQIDAPMPKGYAEVTGYYTSKEWQAREFMVKGRPARWQSFYAGSLHNQSVTVNGPRATVVFHEFMEDLPYTLARLQKQRGGAFVLELEKQKPASPNWPERLRLLYSKGVLQRLGARPYSQPAQYTQALSLHGPAPLQFDWQAYEELTGLYISRGEFAQALPEGRPLPLSYWFYTFAFYSDYLKLDLARAKAFYKGFSRKFSDDYLTIKNVRREGPGHYILELADEAGRLFFLEKDGLELRNISRSALEPQAWGPFIGEGVLMQALALTPPPLYDEQMLNDLTGIYIDEENEGDSVEYLTPDGQPRQYWSFDAVAHVRPYWVIDLQAGFISNEGTSDRHAERIAKIERNKDGSYAIMKMNWVAEKRPAYTWRDGFLYFGAAEPGSQPAARQILKAHAPFYAFPELQWAQTEKLYEETVPLPDLTGLPALRGAFFDKDFFGILDGSTATLPITVNALRYFWGILSPEAAQAHLSDVYSRDEKGDKDFLLETPDFYKMHRKNEQLVRHSGTQWAYKGLLDPKYPNRRLILSVMPSRRELQEADQAGVELEITPIASEAFVFMVSDKNPVESLTVEEIQAVYQGEIADWSKLGGEKRPIAAYQRNKESGSQRAMRQLVMRDKELMKPDPIWVRNFMGPLIRDAFPYQGGEGSIGYSYRFYVNHMASKRNIKLLKINGVEPSDENIANGSYPFVTHYYAVLNKQKSNQEAKDFIAWLKSEAGKALLERVGYLPASF